jgi:hypothetical protein
LRQPHLPVSGLPNSDGARASRTRRMCVLNTRASLMRESACETMQRNHEGPCLYLSKQHTRPVRPVKHSSDQRQGFRWTIQAARMPTNERDQLRRRHWHRRGCHQYQRNHWSQRPRQRVDRTTLVVGTAKTVVAVGVVPGFAAGSLDMVSHVSHSHRLIDFQRMLVD